MIDLNILALVLLILSGVNFILYERKGKDIFEHYNIELLTLGDMSLRTVLSFLVAASTIYIFVCILQGKKLIMAEKTTEK